MKMSELKKIIREEILMLLEKIDLDLERAIKNNILTAADEVYKKWASNSKFGTGEPRWKWDLQGGSKFVKIIRDEAGSRSVWGFVAQNDGALAGIPHKKGDVFLAAGYNKPAKHKRGNAFVKQNWKWTGPDYL